MTVLAHLAETLMNDAIRLQRPDQETARSLDALKVSLLRADIYACGTSHELTQRAESEPKPTLFDGERVKTLPAETLLVYIDCAGDLEQEGSRAALVLSNKQALEIYIFRFSAEKNRWIWPFIGMRYESSNVRQLAVLNVSTLAGLSKTSQAAIAREHAMDAALVIAALDNIREGRVAPLVHKEHRKKTAQPTIRPSSFDQRSRRRHAKGGRGKGKHCG